MKKLYYIDRETGKKREEKVYGSAFIHLFYGDGFFSKGFGLLLHLVAKVPFFSRAYGALQKSSRSKKKVRPFVDMYEVDSSEFADSVDSYQSFNDFFIRKLKPRPIDASGAILPADGRYKIFEKTEDLQKIAIKGKQFSLSTLLGDAALAKRYEEGSIVMARLCPVDYHRFHFPCAGMPGKPRAINGPLYSVNPVALRTNAAILSENKRVITELESDLFGLVQYIEIGATFVGSIKQTYYPNQPCKKGDEKGYFEFGGSCLLLLFEPGVISYDKELISNLEVRAKFGQRLGVPSQR